MNRPHFPIGGRSEAGFTGQSGDPLEGLNAQQNSTAHGMSVSGAVEYMRQLVNRDREFTEARISELRDRVARGDFLTREAAEATASRLFDANFDLE